MEIYSLSSDEEGPDLATYFFDYEMNHEDQIRMCRVYASYLTSLYLKEKKARRSPSKK